MHPFRRDDEIPSRAPRKHHKYSGAVSVRRPQAFPKFIDKQVESLPARRFNVDVDKSAHAVDDASECLNRLGSL
jgi:hypothetical protein